MCSISPARWYLSFTFPCFFCSCPLPTPFLRSICSFCKYLWTICIKIYCVSSVLMLDDLTFIISFSIYDMPCVRHGSSHSSSLLTALTKGLDSWESLYSFHSGDRG